MSGKRRQYPQAQYQQINQPQFPPQGQYPSQQGYGQDLNQAQPSGSFIPAVSQQPVDYLQQQQQQQQPAVGASPNLNGITQGFNNLNIAGNNGVYPPQQQQQQQPQAQGYPLGQTQQSVYGAAQPNYGAASPYDLNQQQQAALPLNQLYQTDLLRELPAPIADLSLPPPPLVIPPHLQTNGGVTDANAPSEYFRSTLNAIPSSNSVLKKSKLPFALVVRPYITLKDDVKPVKIVEDTVISRCRRCRTYINPYVEFIDRGAKWKCNLCSLKNDVPSGFDYNEAIGLAANRNERAELNYSVVEFIAPQQYMVRPPQPLVYVFVIDVSISSIQSGLLATVASSILDTLDSIPNKDERTKVAFIGVDSALHYFSIPEDEEEAENSILVVPDLDEPFVPAPESILVSLKSSRQNIEKLLTSINSLYGQNINPSFALGPALKGAHNLIKSTGGKIVSFASTLPNIGVGKLSVRDEKPFVDKAKEASALLSSNDAFYKSFAVECNKSQVSIEFFLTSSQYQDVASLANLPRYTAGQTHYYPAWSASSIQDVTKLSKEIIKTITQDIALEAVMRTRGSSGLRMATFYGNFFNRSSDLCSFPTFPRDQSYVIEIAIDENINKPVVYFQTAILHSTNYGERRIRVITAAIPVTSNINEVFASADQLAITNFFTHKAIEKVHNGSLNDARELLTKYLIDILTVFKKEVVSGNVGGASPLMLSSNLRMLPLLLHSLTKHLAFRAGLVPSDHRANALNLLGSIPLPQLIRYIYPTVYSLHDIPDEVGLPSEIDGDIVLPNPINATGDSLEKYGLYLINDTTELFLWIGGEAVPELIYDVFGVSDIYQVPIGKFEVPELDNPFNSRVHNIIAKVRESLDTSIYENLYVVRGGSPNEPINAGNSRDVVTLRVWAASHFVEDRSDRSQSYREYLSSLKEKISS
ncbi:hypothetical protein WICMUC_004845 [Wickerhamomyces mucosus]|uniref:Protein transport protein SEC24 n=1 Tax=Wickerhamomyces mucosus TaxID=1378264 RepID=A0A9P8PFM8_9ASCO|nr:hypothetical protein WICMUC_004845 [Wickerhamomyces mucosus]